MEAEARWWLRERHIRARGYASVPLIENPLLGPANPYGYLKRTVGRISGDWAAAGRYHVNLTWLKVVALSAPYGIVT